MPKAKIFSERGIHDATKEEKGGMSSAQAPDRGSLKGRSLPDGCPGHESPLEGKRRTSARAHFSWRGRQLASDCQRAVTRATQ